MGPEFELVSIRPPVQTEEKNQLNVLQMQIHKAFINSKEFFQYLEGD